MIYQTLERGPSIADLFFGRSDLLLGTHSLKTLKKSLIFNSKLKSSILSGASKCSTASRRGKRSTAIAERYERQRGKVPAVFQLVNTCLKEKSD